MLILTILLKFLRVFAMLVTFMTGLMMLLNEFIFITLLIFLFCFFVYEVDLENCDNAVIFRNWS